ncbi:hypothetical protein [Kineosporia babensis]|uniref:Bacterial transcriptional activator domain-containing protein n=1 Tax=Kineosporia babensis TaxID=499548 RepID=A0A9X1T3V4_9ACTN|nr:hypothetical protein [Kineosporia babensis]MCD5316123.1 hypothetical protein [Kineosporia babensis]
MKSLVLYGRALAAAAFLAGIVFGIPLALAFVVGDPLPEWDALRVGDLSDDVLLHVAASFTWLLWAYALILIVAEARAQVSTQPRPSLPGQQSLFQPLVTALLLTAPTVAATVGGSMAPTPPVQPLPGTTAGAPTMKQPATVVHDWRPAPVAQHSERVAAPVQASASSPGVREVFLLGMGAGMGLSLIAATFHTIIRRRRRMAAAGRRPGHLAALSPPEAAEVERALQVGAHLASDIRLRLDVVLATLDVALAARGYAPAAILAVRLDHQRIDLVLAKETVQGLPAPWRRDPDTGFWSLDDPGLDDRDAADPSTFERCWCWIGHSPDGTGRWRAEDVWLLNLQTSPRIRLIADTDHALNIVRAMTFSLDNSDGAGLSVAVDSAADELADLAVLVGGGRRRLPGEPVTLRIEDTLRPSTRRDLSAGATVLVVTDDLESVQPDEVRLVLDASGRLHTSFTTDPIAPARFSEADLQHLRPAVRSALDPPTRRPPEQPQPPLSVQRPPINVLGMPLDAEPSAGGQESTVLGEHTVEDLTAVAGVETGDIPHLAPRLVSTQRLSYQQDPALDEELRLLADPDCPRPRLRILGPIEVYASGPAPSGGQRKPWWCEIVVLLHAHPAGLTYERFVDLLWPRGTSRRTASALPRQTISAARKWMGEDPETGQPYLPNVRSLERWVCRIDGVISDADLARRLRARGVSRGVDGLQDLQTALDLVTGPVLEGRRARGYQWLIENPLLTELVPMIAEIAHTMAVHWLARGEPGKAEAAALKADLAGSYEDVTRLDLIAAARAQGNRADEDRWVQVLLDTHGGEVEEDLPAWTLARLDRIRRQVRYTAS